MSQYKPIDINVGWGHLSRVWNFQFKQTEKDDFFVEPWNNTERADCTFFQPAMKSRECPKVWFFINDDELKSFLSAIRGSLYLYGAYGQVNVLQMRVKGSITQEDENALKGEIASKVQAIIRDRVEATVHKLSEEEAKRLLEIVEKGNLMCFHPEEFAKATYGRG